MAIHETTQDLHPINRWRDIPGQEGDATYLGKEDYRRISRTAIMATRAMDAETGGH